MPLLQSSSSHSFSFILLSASLIHTQRNYRMGATPGNLKATLAGGRRRRLRPTRVCSPRAARRSFDNSGEVGGRKEMKCSKVVSAKLETLKNLIPNGKGSCDSAVQADNLFQDTADYILLLRTQVVILQKFVEVYGSSNTEKEDNSNANAAVL